MTLLRSMICTLALSVLVLVCLAVAGPGGAVACFVFLLLAIMISAFFELRDLPKKIAEASEAQKAIIADRAKQAAKSVSGVYQRDRAK
jgi:hypothetical protein